MIPARRPAATGTYLALGRRAMCFSCVRSTRAGFSSTSMSGCGSSAPSGRGGLSAISSLYTAVLTSPRPCTARSRSASWPTVAEDASTSIPSSFPTGAGAPLISALIAEEMLPFFSRSFSSFSMPSTAAFSAAFSAAAFSSAAFSLTSFSRSAFFFLLVVESVAVSAFFSSTFFSLDVIGGYAKVEGGMHDLIFHLGMASAPFTPITAVGVRARDANRMRGCQNQK
mmetsp:Transcript_12701/g.30274  ORF Transcript_12701/g.30274 Transcript_12701/m.30274 type:complete len:226 (+) Transcript_12701:730-1407(+)